MSNFAGQNLRPMLQHWGNNYYKTSAFAIVLDLPIDIVDFESNLNEHQYSLYLHEYIHFLQDIGTRYGMMKLSNTVLYTKGQAYFAVKNNLTDIPLPAPTFDDEEANYVKANYQSLPFFLGDAVRTIPKKNHAFNKRAVTIVSHKVVKHKVGLGYVESLYLIIQDNNGLKEECLFGGEILCESMAYICEHSYLRNLGLAPNPTKEYPYLMAEKLAEHIYPDINNLEDEWLFWMIDQCLTMSFNPGYVFYLLLKELKAIRFADNPDSDVVLDLLDKILPEIYDLDYMQSVILSELDQVYYIPLFDANKEWLKAEYKRIGLLRKNPHMMRYFMRYEGRRLSHGARIVMQMLGHPVVKNDETEACLRPPTQALNYQQVMNLNLYYFEAYKEVNLALNFRKYPCGMWRDCKRCHIIKQEDIVNGKCQEQLRIYDAVSPRELCPFGVFWKSLGLWGKRPIM